MQKKGMLFGTAMISAFSFACRGIGMLFRLYLASRMGAEGVGLYQLIMSVYALFTSFASAGFTVCVSRLAAVELECGGGESGAAFTSRLAMRLALFTGSFSAVSLASLAIPLSALIPGGKGTALPFAVLALSMPFIALSSCLKGYFLASRRAAVPASAQLFEELCKTGLVFAALSLFMADVSDNAALCAGIAFGLSAGEMLSFSYLCAFYRFSRRFSRKEPKLRPETRVVSAWLPVAASGWLTSGLHAAENVLIPYCFTLYGGGGENALSEFGIIRGMAIPVLFFPFAFVSSFLSVLTPEISRLNAADRSARDFTVGKVLRLTSVISAAAGGIMFFYSHEISECFFHTAQAAHAVRMLAVVTPLMYIETVSDGILKSIGEQKYCMRVTLANCALRIAAVFLLIPKTGAEGYIRLLIVSNTFSFILCAGRLALKCGVRGFKGYFILPLCASACAGYVSYSLSCAMESALARLCAGCGAMLVLLSPLMTALIVKNGHRKPV